MALFDDLFAYNDWANHQLLAITDDLTAAQLAAPMPELGGSTLDLLGHLAQVEAAFLALMTGEERPQREDRPYDEVKALLVRNAAGYVSALPRLYRRLGDNFEVPWFGRSFTIEQALTQVATHSVQHRAGIAAGIARAGLEAPDLDYIIWLSEFR